MSEEDIQRIKEKKLSEGFKETKWNKSTLFLPLEFGTVYFVLSTKETVYLRWVWEEVIE